MKLLIVDNEQMLVDVMRLGFDAKGVDTIPAYDGEQALDIVVKDINHEIGAILTDISMPKMSGWELVTEVKKIRPDIALMILSAEAEARDVGESLVQDKTLVAAFDKASISPIAFAECVMGAVSGSVPYAA